MSRAEFSKPVKRAALTKQDAAVGRDAALSTALKIEAAGDALAATNEEIRGMARALLSNPWRSMESAPKDGTAFIGYQASEGDFHKCMGVVWSWEAKDFWHCADYPGMQPTHWQPLPSPPAPEQSEDVK